MDLSICHNPLKHFIWEGENEGDWVGLEVKPEIKALKNTSESVPSLLFLQCFNDLPSPYIKNFLITVFEYPQWIVIRVRFQDIKQRAYATCAETENYLPLLPSLSHKLLPQTQTAWAELPDVALQWFCTIMSCWFLQNCLFFWEK